jgi:hypothetical protein
MVIFTFSGEDHIWLRNEGASMLAFVFLQCRIDAGLPTLSTALKIVKKVWVQV